MTTAIGDDDRIESEEKRERLKELITHWCEHTKILPHLREYDVPGLVRQILEEFYHITLCCGHMVESCDDGVHIAFNDVGGEVSGLYCKVCAEKYIQTLGAWKIEI